MKTLANCTPREFLRQTNRIRIVAEQWLTATQILEIRKRMPDMPEASQVISKEALRESMEARKQAMAEQMRKNVFAMLEAMLEANADLTLELMALVCFIEPQDIDNYSMSQLLTGISEVINDGGVQAFFASLVKLGLSNTAGASA